VDRWDTQKVPFTNDRWWPIVRFRDPAQELTFSAIARIANMQFRQADAISASGPPAHAV
jgi:hypothetical protein